MESQLRATAFDQLALNTIKANGDDSGRLKLLTFLFGGCAYVSLSDAVHKQGLGVSNSFWNVLSSASGIALGYCLWGEQFTNRQMLGLALGLSGLYLMDGAPK
jgi:multidrug transporter EmrE-like cation transporter